MRTFILLSVVAVMLLNASGLWACSCALPPPPKEALEKASAVFSGKVIKIEDAGEFEKAVTLQVVANWKGADKKEIVIYTPNNGAACGYEFEKGKSYLVYAYTTKRGEEKVLGTNICTRTASLGDAKADLKELGEGVKPR